VEKTGPSMQGQREGRRRGLCRAQTAACSEAQSDKVASLLNLLPPKRSSSVVLGAEPERPRSAIGSREFADSDASDWDQFVQLEETMNEPFLVDEEDDENDVDIEAKSETEAEIDSKVALKVKVDEEVLETSVIPCETRGPSTSKGKGDPLLLSPEGLSRGRSGSWESSGTSATAVSSRCDPTDVSSLSSGSSTLQQNFDKAKNKKKKMSFPPRIEEETQQRRSFYLFAIGVVAGAASLACLPKEARAESLILFAAVSFLGSNVFFDEGRDNDLSYHVDDNEEAIL